MKLFLTLLLLITAAVSGMAQIPVVQAASPAPVAVTPAAAQAGENAVRALEAVKAANLELLKKQQDTLQRLDALQKEAEQIRIFSKRG